MLPLEPRCSRLIPWDSNGNCLARFNMHSKSLSRGIHNRHKHARKLREISLWNIFCSLAAWKSRKEFFSPQTVAHFLAEVVYISARGLMTASMYILTAHWWHLRACTCFWINLSLLQMIKPPSKTLKQSMDLCRSANDAAQIRLCQYLCSHDKRFSASSIPSAINH